jgi:hypothetical protein
MIVSFEFSGCCKGKVTTVYDILNIRTIPADTLTQDELQEGLRNGRYSIAFADFYADADSVENEITGYEVEDEDLI